MNGILHQLLHSLRDEYIGVDCRIKSDIENRSLKQKNQKEDLALRALKILPAHCLAGKTYTE